MTKPRVELSEMEKRFCEEYLVDLKPSAAAVRSGLVETVSNDPNSTKHNDKYKKTKKACIVAIKLLKRANVQEYIDELKAERLRHTRIDSEYVVRRLVVEATRVGGDATHAGRVRALELLGKHNGMFPDRTEIGGTGIPIQTQTLVTLTDDQRLTALSLLMARLGQADPGQVVDGQSNTSGSVLDHTGTGVRQDEARPVAEEPPPVYVVEETPAGNPSGGEVPGSVRVGVVDGHYTARIIDPPPLAHPKTVRRVVPGQGTEAL